jgi:hypothetical protein
MRPTPWLLAEPYRLQAPRYESNYGDGFGAFRIPFPETGAELLALAANGVGAREDLGDEGAFDHVSVSCRNRTPNWKEMSFIKSVFWSDDETVNISTVTRTAFTSGAPCWCRSRARPRS